MTEASIGLKTDAKKFEREIAAHKNIPSIGSGATPSTIAANHALKRGYTLVPCGAMKVKRNLGNNIAFIGGCSPNKPRITSEGSKVRQSCGGKTRLRFKALLTIFY